VQRRVDDQGPAALGDHRQRHRHHRGVDLAVLRPLHRLADVLGVDQLGRDLIPDLRRAQRLLGGDAVYSALSERLGVGHDAATDDGAFWLERIECQAACTHAPVMTVDWEFMDDVTPASAVDIVDRLARGEEVRSTRGPVIRDFRATEHTLAFPDDGLAAEGTPVDAKMLAGLTVAKERGMAAPGIPTAGQEG